MPTTRGGNAAGLQHVAGGAVSFPARLSGPDHTIKALISWFFRLKWLETVNLSVQHGFEAIGCTGLGLKTDLVKLAIVV